jgi:hypothetical protein
LRGYNASCRSRECEMIPVWSPTRPASRQCRDGVVHRECRGNVLVPRKENSHRSRSLFQRLLTQLLLQWRRVIAAAFFLIYAIRRLEPGKGMHVGWLRGRISKPFITPLQLGSCVIGRCPGTAGERREDDVVRTAVARPGYEEFREPSSEGVYDSHASILLPVTQVFGVDGVGSKRLGGGEDGCVPIGNCESLGLLDRDSH